MRSNYINRIAWTLFWSILTIPMAVGAIGMTIGDTYPDGHGVRFGVSILFGFLACHNFSKRHLVRTR